ncbi:hypothetical protein XaplCFBP3123_06040 [Xanthomonas arboricola pv. populi]|nr:hypothetical protein XaplCFBP3123_06040 [Xanthomonas arboricola pv. populi]
MDAAPEPSWTYLRRVLRWWVGKGPAAMLQIIRSAIDASNPCITSPDDRDLALEHRGQRAFFDAIASPVTNSIGAMRISD